MLYCRYELIESFVSIMKLDAMRKTHEILPIAALWLFLALLSGCAKKAPPLNAPQAVFLIVVDTLRPDRLSCYGSTNPTPNIDRFAQSGVMFSRTHSAASWTVPSMGAIMSSLYPTQLGLVEEPAPVTERFPPRERRRQLAYTPPQDVQMLAETLTSEGFHSAAFVNQPFINVLDGFLQGFAEWCYTINETETVWHDTSQPIPQTIYPPGTELGEADSVLVDEFSRWLKVNGDKRPFVWLHLLKPHWPYRPQRRFMANYPGDWRRSPDYERYDAEIRASDELIGRVLSAIDASTGLDKSLVIFTSDHGEAFGEHDGVEHGHSLHREVVDVPLIIASPGVPKQTVVEPYVRTIDIYPTLLELLGVSQPAGLQGKSLMPIIAGERDERVVYAEGMLYGGTERSLVVDEYKLIFEIDGRERRRLYNVFVDPFEERDISQRVHLRTADMRIALESFHTKLAEDSDSPATAADDERVLESLKALGYIGGD